MQIVCSQIPDVRVKVDKMTLDWRFFRKEDTSAWRGLLALLGNLILEHACLLPHLHDGKSGTRT